MKEYSKSLKIHNLIHILLLLLLIAADQLSKGAAERFLKNQPDIPLIGDALVLHYLENQGAAFGFFQNRLWMFLLISILILAVVVYLYLRITLKLYRYTQPSENSAVIRQKTWRNMVFLLYLLVFLASGAIGNLIDRIVRGYVIDFIYVQLIQFPVFNLADIFVTGTAFVLVIYFIFIYKEDDRFKKI